MIIKLLAKIGLHKAIIRYAFNFQSKPKSFELLTQCFVDSEGRKYYKYNDDVDLPIRRLAALQFATGELSSCIDSQELELFLDAMSVSMERILRPQPGQPSGLAQIGHLLQEMKLRKAALIREDILFKLAAIQYIREDEDPAEYDAQLTSEKIEQFKKDSDGGLRDFFYGSGLKEYLPYSKLSDEDWTTYLTISSVKVKALKKASEMIISSGRN